MKHKISVQLVRAALTSAALLQAASGFTADAATVSAIAEQAAETGAQSFVGKLASQQALSNKSGHTSDGPD